MPIRHFALPLLFAGIGMVGCALASGCAHRTAGHSNGIPNQANEELSMTRKSADNTTRGSVGGSTSRYHVVGLAYAAPTKVLYVRLASGIYRYNGVPQDVADRFARSTDQDGFFLDTINDSFPTTYLSSSASGYAEADQALTDASAKPNPTAPPPRSTLPVYPGDGLDAPPADVGSATMLDDGTLRLNLRSETDHGIAESLLIVSPNDARYSGMVKHLGGIKPGETCRIPPFPEPTIDPDTVP